MARADSGRPIEWPEPDVHPESLTVRAAVKGGTIQQTIRVTNIGYRLLGSTHGCVEPAGSPWLRLRPEHGRPFSTIDQSDLPIEIDFPESIDRPLRAAIVIESNGGTKRIGVRVERSTGDLLFGGPAVATTESPLPEDGQRLHVVVASLPPAVRIALCCAEP